MSGHEQAFVADAFATNWLSSVGPNLDAFEAEVAQRLGGGVSTLAVSSGTAALHLILRYLGVTSGDHVAVSTLTFAGSVFPIMYLGATPVFIDSERTSWNIDPDAVATYLHSAAKKGRLPKALVAVHLYGQHCDIDAIASLCDEFGVTLVEDAAESLGSTYRGRQTATTAAFSLLSFNGNKIITTTGGGMVVARDPAALATMRKWSAQAREPAAEYVHRELGYNYRLSNVLAGIGRGQLRVLDERVAQRRAVAERYAAAFAGVSGISMQPAAAWGLHTRWLSVISLDARAGARPAALVDFLERADIEARPVWRPMHTQPVFADAPRVGGSVAEELYASGLCLPSSSSLPLDDQRRVVERITRCLASEAGAPPPSVRRPAAAAYRGAARDSSAA